jgi:hypothetical protein
VDTRNSQKKSPRTTAKSRQQSSGNPETPETHRKPFVDTEEEENHMDYSLDHVARVRAAKDAAQREMESFGDVSEYDITTIRGQLTENSTADSQPSLDFERDVPTTKPREA